MRNTFSGSRGLPMQQTTQMESQSPQGGNNHHLANQGTTGLKPGSMEGEGHCSILHQLKDKPI